MKTVKNLIVPAIVLFAMIVFAVVYFSVESFHNKKANSSSVDNEVEILNLTAGDISSVSVYNKAKNTEIVVSCASGSTGEIVYELKGDDVDEGETYSQTKLADYVSGLIYYISNVTASTTADYSEYGLDDPHFKITITTREGNSTIVCLGNKSPDDMYCYMCIQGASEVYCVNSMKLSLAEKTFIDFFEEIALDIDLNDVRSVHFERTTDGLALDANVKNPGSGIADFEIYSPVKHGASGYFGNMIDSVASLTASEFVSNNLADRSKYGLDRPVYSFSFTHLNGSKDEVYFSKVVDDYCYGYIKNVNRIFLVYENQIDGVDLQDTILIDPYICYCYAKNISSITGVYGSKSFKFALQVSDSDSIVSDNSVVTLDGRNAKISDSSGRSYCSLLFESIACIKIGGIEIADKAKPSSAAELSLTFIEKNYATSVYEFYRRDLDTYYVFKDGEYMNFYVYATEIFNDGGTDTYSYGYWRAYELLNQAITDNRNGIYDL